MNHHIAVAEFHQKFGLPIGERPRLLSGDTAGTDPGRLGEVIVRQLESVEDLLRATRREGDVGWGRVQMMTEELREFIEAYAAGDLPKAADALVDLEYFVLGTVVMMGLPWDQLFAEVHRANMTKVRVESTEESRRLNKLDVKKPEGWQAPDIEGILNACAAR